MRVRALACLMMLASSPSMAAECANPWTMWAGCGTSIPSGSLVATFLMDHNNRKGDTDADGDRQGGEVAARLRLKDSPYLPDGQYVFAARSMLNSSQQASASPQRRIRQYDEVPSSATFGYEGENLSGYLLGGTVNQRRAALIWHDVKMMEHRRDGLGSTRASPLSGPSEFQYGFQVRYDEGALFTATDILKLATVVTAFTQVTSIKTEVGAAFHAALGTWEKAPRFTVSDLPSTPLTGSGVWLGAEASYVGYEQLTQALGTANKRLSVVGGVSLSPGHEWPSLALTTRLMVTEQVEGAGRRGVGEYRIQATFPFQ